jgi:hypothetical protein
VNIDQELLLEYTIFLEPLKDVAQIFFYITLAIVACQGLRKWQKESKGKVEYDAAKQALIKAYSIRDRIRILQITIIIPSEWAEREISWDETDDERRVNNSFFAYNKRFKHIREETSRLYPAIVEAEAVFGIEARAKLDKLINMTKRLRVAIQIYHKLLSKGLGRSGETSDKYFNIIDGINGVSEQTEELIDDDNFKTDLDDVMQEIQDYFIQKMGRK